MASTVEFQRRLLPAPPTPARPVLVPGVTNKELSSIVTFYTLHVRSSSPSERLGIISALRRLLAKGVTVDQLQVAAATYAADPFVVASDVRARLTIRAFFGSVDNVTRWQVPMRPNPLRKQTPVRDSALDALDRLDELPRQPRRTQADIDEARRQLHEGL